MTMRCCSQQTSLPRDVTHEELVDILNTKSAVVVDVRTAEELTRHGDIPGAINIPLGDLEVMIHYQRVKRKTLSFLDSIVNETKEIRVFVQR